MITREVAVLLAYPDEILTLRRLGRSTRLGRFARHPGDPDGDSSEWTDSDLRPVPVFEEHLPIAEPGSQPEAWEAMCVMSMPGPRGERLLGRRGISREHHRIMVESRGQRADDSKVPSGVRGALSYEDARERAQHAHHVIACAQNAPVLRDWPGMSGIADAVANGPHVTFGEITVFPVSLMEKDEDGRPVYGFAAEIVRWRPD